MHFALRIFFKIQTNSFQYALICKLNDGCPIHSEWIFDSIVILNHFMRCLMPNAANRINDKYTVLDWYTYTLISWNVQATAKPFRTRFAGIYILFLFSCYFVTQTKSRDPYYEFEFHKVCICLCGPSVVAARYVGLAGRLKFNVKHTCIYYLGMLSSCNDRFTQTVRFWTKFICHI